MNVSLGFGTEQSVPRQPLHALLAIAIAALSTAPLYAATQPQNLGYGLDKLVASQVALKAAGANAAAMAQAHAGYATAEAAEIAAQAITDADSGRVLVDITLTGRIAVDAVKADLASRFPQLTITAVDASYRSTGILEGYASLDDVTELSRANGVRAVFLGLKPETNTVPAGVEAQAIPGPVSKIVQTSAAPTPDANAGTVLNKIGTAFDQGVVQHRVDRISKLYNPDAPVSYDGAGITVAAMSDSYDTRGTAPTASAGVASFDLPGAPTNPINTQPVQILAELTSAGSDEGRAMVEIIHKMAPKARLGFASGSLGEVAFGNSIRNFAHLPGFPGISGFRADVIVDDISYGGEPFYGESIIGNAIDEAAAAGVSYFSSAGNNVGINAYESALRLVSNGTGLTAAAGNTALAGTNIDLTGVPAGLYAGGFHNFNPAGGQLDVAQLVNMPASGTSNTEMQWDDPYDVRALTLNQPPIFSASGSIPVTTATVTYDGTTTPALPVFTAGTPYVVTETATSGDFDGIIDILDPSGTVLFSQDTGTDEVVTFYAPVSGQYKIVVKAFSPTTGGFNLTVNTGVGTAGVTTDLNLLVFRADTGAYIATRSLTSNNLANNRPVESGVILSPSLGQVQFLISRANSPVAPQLPTRVRWSTRGNGAAGIGPAEYFTYNAVTTKGHASAKGCNGTAAYGPFRPNLPEAYTSPGPATILFDKNAVRLATPDIREVPRVAAVDFANNSFFASDTTSDYDANPNFSGTSAAAPHAAAIAALVLQANGGPGSVTPAAMTTILQKSAFPHDLDPSRATGTAATSDGGTVSLVIDSDNDSNALTGQNDPSSFKLSYSGAGSIASITFNPAGTAVTGGHVTGGNNGIQDNTPATSVIYFENNFPGLIFLPATKAFTLGPLTGLSASDITAPLSTSPYTGFANLAGAPANGTSQFWTMTIGFPTAAFTAGKTMRFTVGRGAQHSSAIGTLAAPIAGQVTSNPIADLFGGGVFLPSGVQVNDGMTFSGTTTGGGTFTGTIKNNIGAGYSPVDGYGLINAEKAVGFIFRNGFDSLGN